MALGDYYGPLPLWGWIALGGGGLFLYEKHKGGGSSGSGGLLSGLLGGNTSTADTAQSTQGVVTNDQWAADAVEAAIANGANPLQADYAVRNYMSGAQLDPQSQTILAGAISDLGEPPSPVAGGAPDWSTPVMNTPSQPAAPPHNTTQAKYYTVKKGDTQKKLDEEFGLKYSQLTALNPDLAKKGSQIHAGEKVRIQ